MEKYSWLGQAPEYPEERIDETLSADVIICGGGLAGVAAARAAVECGARCILFEKCAAVQGRSGQFAVIGGKLLERWGIDTTQNREKILDALMAESGSNARRDIFSFLLDHIGEDLDWYLKGLPEDGTYFAKTAYDAAPEGTRTTVLPMRWPAQKNYHPEEERWPVYPATINMIPSHVPVLRRNLELAMQTGRLRVFFSTPVRRLLVDPDSGRVTGVIAEDHDGNVIRALAAGAVILATGDYSGDPEMLETFFPEFAGHPRLSCGVTPDKKPANTGDGHRMAMWIGARLEEGEHCINCHNMGGAMGVTPFLMLNTEGKRFMNEDVPGHAVERGIMACPGQTAWQIFDNAWPEQIPYMPVGHGACSDLLPEAEGVNKRVGPMDSYASAENLRMDLERGGTVTADTPEDLAEKAGLPVSEFLRSVERYNALAESGEDPDFGKPGRHMFPLVNPPYYASRISSAPMLCTHSGLVSDPDCACYGTDGNVIPGLLLAGNVQGSRFSGDYPTVMPGISHSMALTYGRRAGQLAADLVGK